MRKRFGTKTGNGNGAGKPIGVAVAAPAAAEERPVGTVIVITDEEKESLVGLHSEFMNLKLAIGEMVLASEDLQLRINETVEKARAAGTKLQSTADSVIKSHGVPLDQPGAGNWHVNIQSGEIQRMS